MGWPADPAFLLSALDAIPSPLLVVDDDMRVEAYNAAAAPLLGEAPSLVMHRRTGEVLHCIHSTEAIGGCGASPACKDCVVRLSVGDACSTRTTVQRPQRMQLEGPSGVRDLYVLVTAAFLSRPGEPRALLIFQDIGDLVTAQGLIPVCMHCRRVRDSARGWGSMESYLKEHLDLDISHGLCPECLKKHYPDFAEEDEADRQPGGVEPVS